MTHAGPDLAGDPNYALRWPSDLFADEARRLVDRGRRRGVDRAWLAEVGVLLGQAFTSQVPADDFRELVLPPPRPATDDRRSDPVSRPEVWLDELAAESGSLLGEPSLRPYHSQRDPARPTTSGYTLADTCYRVGGLVSEFHEDGFFDGGLGVSCVDDGPPPVSTPERELDRRVGKGRLWTSDPNNWTESDLFDYIEVFHDLAARPVEWRRPDFGGRGLHVGRSCRRSGQALYRWRVNRLLQATRPGFALSDSEENLGRVVRSVPPGLDRLVGDALDEDAATREQVRHAVAAFRRRDATREELRSALRSLAAALEHHRGVLKDNLLSEDEGALFRIANRFDIRHRNADQHGDYGDEFVEWIFYWYLATVNLAERLADDRNADEW